MKHNLLDDNLKDLIISLRRKGRESDNKFLVSLSDMLDVSRRRRAKINVFKIGVFAKRNKDKIFVVPGTVLGYGSIDLPVNVYALRYSKGAQDKISLAKGVAKTFDSLLKDDVSGRDIVFLR